MALLVWYSRYSDPCSRSVVTWLGKGQVGHSLHATALQGWIAAATLIPAGPFVREEN